MSSINNNAALPSRTNQITQLAKDWIVNHPTTIKTLAVTVPIFTLLLAAATIGTTISAKLALMTFGACFGIGCSIGFWVPMLIDRLTNQEPPVIAPERVAGPRYLHTPPAETPPETHQQTTVEQTPPPLEPLAPRYQNALSKHIRKLEDPTCKGDAGGIYLTTNESGSEIVRAGLRERPLIPDGCHIGFSGLHNFDIMAIRKSGRAILCDFNPHNKELIEATVDLLKNSKDRYDFVNKIKIFIEKTERKLGEAVTIDPKKGLTLEADLLYFSSNFLSIDSNGDIRSETEEMEHQLIQEGSWLSSDESFAWIQTLAKQDKITALNLDIRDHERFSKMAKLLTDNGIPIDSLYLSNIGGWMSEENDRKNYAKTVDALLSRDTLLIHCPHIVNGLFYTQGKGPKQRLDLGKTLQERTDDEALFKIHLSIEEEKALLFKKG